MKSNDSRGETLRRTMIKKFGSEAKWKAWMRSIARKGGTTTYESGQLDRVNFRGNRERAKIAGARGGRISRRRPRDL